MIRKRAQSILEYAGLIAIVVGALIAMQVIIKRGLQGKMRETADDIGAQYDVEKGGYHYKSALQGQRVEISVLGDSDLLPEPGPGQGISKRYTEGSYTVKVGEKITSEEEANLGW